jgi:Family of unknown function (DUF6527)
MINTIKVKLVHYVPKELEPGFLYVSKEFGIAGHMCPCGCGNKIITPIGPTDWSLTIKKSKPTLYPSIGNWQIPCRSHYWIKDGSIQWSSQWTKDQILTGRQKEEERRKSYYSNLAGNKKNQSIFRRLLNWILRKK